MKILKIALIVLITLLAALVVFAPIGPVPGFFIGGTAAQAPEPWPDTSATHEIRLKVPGALPRVVIIWVVEHDEELYVVGAPDSGWVSMIGEGAPVEMRLGEVTYPLVASRVTEGWQPVVKAYLDKYRPHYPDIVAGFPEPEEAEGQFALFRLDRG